MKTVVFVFFVLVVTLSGCAHQTFAPAIDNTQHYQQQLLQLSHWQLEGKISIRHANKSDSAALRWQQDGDHFDIFLSGPLGAGATRLTGTPKQLSIQNSEEETTSTSDPEQLLEKNLGWALPLEELPQWILGSSDSSNKQFNIDHTLSSFEENNWQVEYKTYQIVEQWLLPEKIILKHGDMQITIAIKQWRIAHRE